MDQRRIQLSKAELGVLVAIAQGLRNSEIAANQFRSVETIRSHVRSILKKLSASNRAHAVAIAYHVGLFRGRPAVASLSSNDVHSPLLRRRGGQEPVTVTQPSVAYQAAG